MKFLILFLFMFCTIPVFATTAKRTADSTVARVKCGYAVFSFVNLGEDL